MGDQLVQLEAVDRAALPRLIVGRIRDFMTDQRLQPGDRLAPEQMRMEQLRDIVELRRAIEPMAASLVAERSTDDDIADLRALLEGHQRGLAADPGWHWEPLEVEPAIAESTGNMLPVQMQRTLQGLWVGRSRGLRATVDHTAEWLHEHLVIRDAITARHAARAQCRAAPPRSRAHRARSEPLRPPA